MNLTNMMLSERSRNKRMQILSKEVPQTRGLMIPPLLSLSPPPRDRGLVRGGLGLRSDPYGVVGGRSMLSTLLLGQTMVVFHKGQRYPQRLTSWSLVKIIWPLPYSKDVLQDVEDKFDGHC